MAKYYATKEMSAVAKFFDSNKFDYVVENGNTVEAWRENNNAIEYCYKAVFDEDSVEVTRYKYTSFGEDPIEVVITPPKHFFGFILNGERVF